VLTRVFFERGPGSVAQLCGEGRVGCEAGERGSQSPRISGRHEEGALLVDEELAGRLRVRGHERGPAGERLEGLVGDHPAGLARGSEDPEGAPGAVELVREALIVDPADPLDVGGPVAELLLELAAADEAERQLRR